MFKYIDISTHQKNVDYESVKNAGIHGVILRAGQTGSARKTMAKDEMFETHYAGFKRVGVPIVGVYWYSRATNLVEAFNEARECLKAIEGKSDIKNIFYDIEDPVYQAKISKEALTSVALEFLQTIEKSGYRAGVYSYLSYIKAHLNMSAFEKYLIWVAQYYHTLTYQGRVDIWQYTSTEKIAGFQKGVDANHAYIDLHSKPTPVNVYSNEYSLLERTLRTNAFKITSPFGMRMHPITKVWSMHNGIDAWTNGENWKCYALENGVVTGVGYDTKTGAGNYVWVDYARLGIRVCLFHLAEYFVKRGQKVNSETVLGLVGNTGSSTATHLHLGVRRIGSTTYINPDTIKWSEQPIPVKKYLYLHKAALSWRVYPLNKPAIVGNEVGKLAPSKFGGLKYEIIESLPNDVYVIKTQTYGMVKIWAGKGSLSTIKEE